MKPNILLTNDDGIHAIGIQMLAKYLVQYGNVYIVAPARQQSAKSHCIHCFEPIKIEEIKNEVEGIQKSYMIHGSPADCVRVGLTGLGVHFDYVFSGMNDGPNLGYDISYSGTASAAMEGILLGVPSVAISCDFKDHKHRENDLKKIIDYIFCKNLFLSDAFLNVNFPKKDFDKILGYRFTKMGKMIFTTTYKIQDGLCIPGGEMGKYGDVSNTDIEAYFEGYVSISPLYPDKTCYDILGKLQKI